MRLVPSLKKSALVGALQYYDAQVDDARHTMELARTAASYGAHVANRVKVTGFLRQGERVTGVQAKDLESGREFEVRAKQVVNATGVWTDDTQAMVGERGQYHVRASKGIHLVVPKDRIQSSTGMILRTEKSVLFIIPWGRHWLIGTTDTDWNLDKAHPAATSKDIEYLLDHVNAVLVTPLTREDVEGVYAGLRPLLAGESESTSKLSREHVVAHAAPGLVVVAGGKYTTYRVMAKDAIDAAAKALDGRVPKSVTKTTPLVGADGYQALWNQRHLIAQRSGLHVARIEHLLNRYGALIDEVLALVEEDPSLGEQLPGTQDYLQGRDRLRRHDRRRPAPGRRPGPPDPDLDRGLGPRRRRRRGRRPADGPGPRLGRGHDRARGLVLPAPRRVRTRLPGPARRRVRRQGPPRSPGHRLAGLNLGA